MHPRPPTSLEIAQSPSRCFNHPMRRNVLSTFLFVATLGLGCMGVAVPGRTDELKHPIELGAKYKAKIEYSLSSFRWKNQYYKAFAYAYDAKGRYTCALNKDEGRTIKSCNDTRGAAG